MSFWASIFCFVGRALLARSGPESWNGGMSPRKQPLRDRAHGVTDPRAAAGAAPQVFPGARFPQAAAVSRRSAERRPCVFDLDHVSTRLRVQPAACGFPPHDASLYPQAAKRKARAKSSRPGEGISGEWCDADEDRRRRGLSLPGRPAGTVGVRPGSSPRIVRAKTSGRSRAPPAHESPQRIR